MKNQTFTKLLFLMALLLAVFTANAQYKVKQVIVANGGIFFGPGNQITVGSYNPDNHTYTLFDSVSGNSVTQVLINNGTAYMATDSYLVSYNLDNLKRTNIALVKGLRYIALYKDMIAATIGDDGTSAHFKLFKQTDLSLVYSEPAIPVFSEGIAIAGDSAFIAMQGSWPNNNDTGKIAVVDLVNHKLSHIITLDTAARGIGQVYFNGNIIVGVTEYPSATLSEVNIKTGSQKIIPSIIYSPFDFIGDSLYGDINGGIGNYNLNTKNDHVFCTPNTGFYAAAALDTVHKLFYYTGGSFTKPTKTWVVNYNGTVTDSFDVGISPQGLAFDYREKTGIISGHIPENNLQLFPNPAQYILHISGIPANNPVEISVSDITGKTVLTENKTLAGNTGDIRIDALNTGMYIVKISSATGILTSKFIKNLYH